LESLAYARFVALPEPDGFDVLPRCEQFSLGFVVLVYEKSHTLAIASQRDQSGRRLEAERYIHFKDL